MLPLLWMEIEDMLKRIICQLLKDIKMELKLLKSVFYIAYNWVLRWLHFIAFQFKTSIDPNNK